MKNKITMIIIALTLSVGAFAKTEAELLVGLPKNDTQARIEYCKANAKYIEPLFKAWCEKGDFNDTSKNELFAPYYYGGLNQCDVPVNCASRLSVGKFFNDVGIEGYNEIKKLKWIIDGVEIPEPIRTQLALWAKDAEVVFKMDIERLSNYEIKSYVPRLRIVMLSTTDYASAKAFCNEYEKQMLLRGIATDSAEYQAIQSVGKFLTQRLIEQKIK